MDIIKKIINEISQNAIGDEKGYFLFHQHRFEQLFSLLGDYDKDSSLLDVGAFELHGLLGAYYLGFHKIFGIDLGLFNDLSVSRAAKIGAIIKNCDLEKEKIPFSDQSFDLVILSETLEHFNFHPQRVFTEIYRVLKPEGELIITTPNLLRLNNRLKLILGKSINSDLGENYGPGTHYREYSAAELEFLLRLSGLKKKKLIYADFDYPNRGRVEALSNKIVGTVFPGLRSNLVMIGRK
ncbi:MAG TPA: class I SAM-dependent methyltransferase [Candidatus Methylomirabilis sp.]|nr:class I SAM-dependent methyltransferase [Candidatus Methylomirabilis sp.]